MKKLCDMKLQYKMEKMEQPLYSVYDVPFMYQHVIEKITERLYDTLKEKGLPTKCAYTFRSEVVRLLIERKHLNHVTKNKMRESGLLEGLEDIIPFDPDPIIAPIQPTFTDSEPKQATKAPSQTSVNTETSSDIKAMSIEVEEIEAPENIKKEEQKEKKLLQKKPSPNQNKRRKSTDLAYERYERHLQMIMDAAVSPVTTQEKEYQRQLEISKLKPDAAAAALAEIKNSSKQTTKQVSMSKNILHRMPNEPTILVSATRQGSGGVLHPTGSFHQLQHAQYLQYQRYLQHIHQQQQHLQQNPMQSTPQNLTHIPVHNLKRNSVQNPTMFPVQNPTKIPVQVPTPIPDQKKTQNSPPSSNQVPIQNSQPYLVPGQNPFLNPYQQHPRHPHHNNQQMFLHHQYAMAHAAQYQNFQHKQMMSRQYHQYTNVQRSNSIISPPETVQNVKEPEKHQINGGYNQTQANSIVNNEEVVQFTELKTRPNPQEYHANIPTYKEFEAKTNAGDTCSQPPFNFVEQQCRFPTATPNIYYPQINQTDGGNDDSTRVEYMSDDSDDSLSSDEEDDARQRFRDQDETFAMKSDELPVSLELKLESCGIKKKSDLGDLSSDDEMGDGIDYDLIDNCKNLILCQYDKVTRHKSKFKLTLLNGMMSLKGREMLFRRAVGEACLDASSLEAKK